MGHARVRGPTTARDTVGEPVARGLTPVEQTQRVIQIPDGPRLHVESWSPEGEPKFVVVISHGGAEHVSRYAHVAESLVKRGGFVFGPDHRGQGRSGGIPGHVESFEQYASDLRHVMQEIAEILPEGQRPGSIPWFLLGHSMGGLISLTYLLEHAGDIPLRGVILSSPLLGLTMKVNPVKLALGKVAAKLMPRLTLPSGIPPEAISRDEDVVQKYVSDNLRVGVVSARWFQAMNQAISRVNAEAEKIDVPLLWYVGTADKICDHEASVRVFGSIPDPEGRDQTFKVFDGYFHELHNEPEEDRKRVLAMIGTWIDKRLGDS